MGKWAEKMLDLAERPHSINEFNAAYNAVANLESDLESALKRNAELAEIAKSALDGWAEFRESNHYGPSPAIADLAGRLGESRASTDYVNVRERDAALDGLSKIVGRDARAIGSLELGPANTTAGTIMQMLDRQPKIEGLLVVVMAPRQKYNPDLLERASTLLMEAYIEAKKAEP